MPGKAKQTKILIVEDQPIAARVVRYILTQLGVASDVAVTGKEALEKHANQYDLILMDIGLPDMTGVEVTLEIRRREKGNQYTPIVALTAYSDPALEIVCEAIGMEEVIHKPATPEKLSDIIVKYCGTRQSVVECFDKVAMEG